MGTLSGTTTPGQSGPGSNGNEGVVHIPQSSRTGASPIRWFSVISRPLVGREHYPSAEMQLVYSTAPGDWAQSIWFIGKDKKLLKDDLPWKSICVIDF